MGLPAVSTITNSQPNIRVLMQSHSVGVPRIALQDFTLSDGTFIPAGTTIAATAWCTHMDENRYEEPTIFKPWRFLDMGEEDGKSTKYHFVNTASDYMVFGHGKHAWYDRFHFHQ